MIRESAEKSKPTALTFFNEYFRICGQTCSSTTAQYFNKKKKKSGVAVSLFNIIIMNLGVHLQKVRNRNEAKSKCNLNFFPSQSDTNEPNCRCKQIFTLRQ